MVYIPAGILMVDIPGSIFMVEIHVGSLIEDMLGRSLMRLIPVGSFIKYVQSLLVNMFSGS